ncbi:hypothetical protein H5410_048721 [Solanum commersonii]|uniref:Uncharacterized protein n=1 Tax=Solanum commersonii TaxID=4109 RepID=A0A9J5XLA9_SOLCO|nr:hypothetical protein H5410_048721 [Solanum commersonii]
MRSKAKQQKKIKGKCSNEDTCVFPYDIIVNILIKLIFSQIQCYAQEEATQYSIKVKPGFGKTVEISTEQCQIC